MSADSSTDGLARFDTRQRPVHDQQDSHQTDFRLIDVREHGQLALDKVQSPHAVRGSRAIPKAHEPDVWPARAGLVTFASGGTLA
jgi:hypothetical protein